MGVKLVIIGEGKDAELKDAIEELGGEVVDLERNGKSRGGSYDKYKEPEKYTVMGTGIAPLIVSVYRKPGWSPSDGE